MPKTRKALNFDLDTKALEKYYPGKTYHQAYYDIRSYLESYGYQHRQGSGYVSKEPVAVYKVTLLLDDMALKYPWLTKCIREIDVTSIGNTYNLLSHLKDLEEERFNNTREQDLNADMEIDIEDEMEI